MPAKVSNTPTYSTEEFRLLSNTLLSPSESLAKRFNALFTLKSTQSLEAIDIIQRGFDDKSELFKHELAYVLGQMNNPAALECLYSVLTDKNQEVMVRHEAAEAIGAIGQSESIPILRKFENDSLIEVRQTVELAIESILLDTKDNSGSKLYHSIDPAPPADGIQDAEQLEAILLDTNETLFKRLLLLIRYRAMFSLRNLGTTQSVLSLSKGFLDKSALFRHEIAYVFGQMQHIASVESLIIVLSNENEKGMVRHEAAEALGSIASPECFDVLKRFANDENDTVRDSCIIGLEMYDFETKNH